MKETAFIARGLLFLLAVIGVVFILNIVAPCHGSCQVGDYYSPAENVW